MTQSVAGGQPLPLPDDFAIDFAPGDELLYWTRDRMHFPKPIAMMMHSLMVTEGINDAFRVFGVPLRCLNGRLNTYHYRALAPTVHEPQEAAAAGAAAQRAIRAAALRIGTQWHEEFLPRVLEHIAHLEGLDLPGASNERLGEYLADALGRHRDMWAIHFRTVMAAHTAMELFNDFYDETFETNDPFEALRLIEGFDNLTLQANRQLWLLGREAIASPAVRAVVETVEPGSIVQALRASPEGRDFLTRFDAFLGRFGERGGDQFVEIAEPFLIEDPTPCLKTLQEHVRHPERDWDQERAQIAADRERAVAGARERLAAYPAPVREQFEQLLAAAQAAVVLAEDHGFYIDSKGMFRMRQLVLAGGRRLADGGALSEPEDVFMLTLEELRAGLGDADADYRPLVSERRSEMRRYAAIAPPEAVGTPAPGGAPRRGRFFGEPHEPTGDPRLLMGSSGSPGKVVARARLVRGLSQAGVLQAGEVLVAETTSPIWTPLFCAAAAVVTETGGILSHCAVVAREYRIPAVVGVQGAMSAVRDGQLIEVDGDAGTVRLLE